MKNININKFLLGILLIILSVSCEDALDKKPLDLISEDAVWQDETLVNSYFAHLYNSAQFLFGGTYFSPDLMMREISHGGAARHRGNHPGYRWVDGRMNGDSDGPLSYWKYGTVRQINVAIEALESAENSLSADFTKMRLGEAYFLRAYIYFEMVKRYGGMPLVSTVQDISLPTEELEVPRSTEAASYDFIAADCDKAIGLLADLSPEYGRATKWAALALKSRAMLYAGSIGKFGTVQKEGLVGIPNPDKYWQLSMEASLDLINNGPFSLYDEFPNGGTVAQKASSYRKIFTEVPNCEVIFAEDFTGEGGRATNWEYYYHPETKSHGNWGAFSKVYFETLEWFDNIDGSSGKLDGIIGPGKFFSINELFGKRDPRFHASIAIQEDTYDGEPVYMHQGTYVDGKLTTSGFYDGIPGKGDNRNSMRSAALNVKGLKGGNLSDDKWLGDNDWVVFRLGEIYLNYVEAAFALGDPYGDALYYLNAIRKRAGMPDRSELNWDVIKSERQVELIFEHHRFWDLRRWRDAVDVLTDVANGGTSTFSAIVWRRQAGTGKYEITTRREKNYPDLQVGYRNFLEKHYYLPITLGRIKDNPVLIENPGYEDN